MHHLPAPTAGFSAKKEKILELLAVPTSSYTDASPKGSVDVGIRDLIDEVNKAPGLVTTSSCAGRVSVFLEGRRTATDGDAEREEVASVGGKGAGGTWLFVSHDPVGDDETWIESLKVEGQDETGGAVLGGKEQRLIHFKFEPMVSFTLSICSREKGTCILRPNKDPPRPRHLTIPRPAPPAVRTSSWLP